MSQRLWLLVEWIDEDTVFPCYGIVHIDRFAYKGSDISPGNQILLRMKVNEPRRAKIVQVADNKQNVEDQKQFLERQEQRLNYVMEKCMRRIDALQSAQQQCNQPAHGCHTHKTKEQKPLPVIISANTDEDDYSDQDVESNILSYDNKLSHSAQASVSKYQREDLSVPRTYGPVIINRRTTIVRSTPRPESRQDSPIKLCFDQGTQTDIIETNTLNLKQIEAIEVALRQLEERYQRLVDHAKNGCDLEEEDQEIDRSLTDDTADSTNSSCVEENMAEINDTQQNVVIPRQMPTTSTVKTEEPAISNAENQPCSSNTRVRRMSAQTTDPLDLVPIGDGHAMIPARVLNEIDFRSYTTATRQLLQAVFSRHVLATHSLTGRQSPAHANKPPKKILDPKLVNDIVKTVVARCGVTTSLARNCITVKCTDEAKLYRNRQINRESRQRKHHQNDENMPSTHTSSDEFN